jgi:imidazoleglycerol phosphate dehydratase HisB
MQPKMGKMDIDYQVCFIDHLLMLLQSHMDYHCIIHVVNIQHGGTAELGY